MDDFRINNQMPKFEDLEFWQYPGLAITFKENANIEIVKKEFENDFINQYKYFDSIGFNVIDSYEIYDISIFKTFLNFVNINYIGISDLDNILMDEKKTISFGYFVYDVLFCDLFKHYIPNIISLCDDRSKNYFESILINPEDFKIILNKYLHSTYDILTKNNTNDTNDTRLTYLKIVIAIDLFDNDLTDLINNLILPVISIDDNWEYIYDRAIELS